MLSGARTKLTASQASADCTTEMCSKEKQSRHSPLQTQALSPYAPVALAQRDPLLQL